MTANDVTTVAKQKAILLSKVNAETYDEINKIRKPNKPKDKTYEEIVELVKNHLRPPASYLICIDQVFDRECSSKIESIIEYASGLKNLEIDCQFTNLEQVLDQSIVGLKSKTIKADLLKIESPTLTQC